MRDLAAFTCVCEDDSHWIPQYLREAERLDLEFAVHFDRCSEVVKASMSRHPLCVGTTGQDDPDLEYTEKHKQEVFNLLCDLKRWPWAVHWDIDEVWEDAFAEKFEAARRMHQTHLTVLWINVWGNWQTIRNDPVEEPGLMRPSPRVKIYKIAGGQRWRFDHPIIYGCKEVDAEGNTVSRNDHKRFEGNTDIGCIHSGLMTHELRLQHAERWDRIYGKAVGENPYKFWHCLLDPVNYPPTLAENTFRRIPT